ncbi:MAG TPA: alanine racemase [Candidatus Faecicola pullistercoris]|nr:alanine racemase [Candidatus Faecicola pullistercoris]
MCIFNGERVKAEIDLSAVDYNFSVIRSKACGARVMAVVKADAYGHGAEQIARFLQAKADFFGVAGVSEGAKLREAGIKNPVLVLGCTPENMINSLIDYDLSATVNSLSTAEKLSAAALKRKTKVKVHLAVDTGMTRLGFDRRDYFGIAKALQTEGLEPEGIFTHFASADTDAHSLLRQKAAFDDLLKKLSDDGVSAGVTHAANSAALLTEGNCGYGMVRAGLALYGVSPFSDKGNSGLKEVMSMKARIVQIKKVPSGTEIGYGGTFVTKRPSLIATVSAGYADGYPWRLSNTGRILVKGRYAPVAGRICMDQFMADVSEIDGVDEGDEAVLAGCQGGRRITMAEIAREAGSTVYEQLCRTGARVPRIYLKN